MTLPLPPSLLDLQQATRAHQRAHGCNAHTFEDGAGLWRLVADEQPSRVLELGTGLGYTACLMALASPASVIDTLEGDTQHAALAREQIARLGLQQRVRLHEGSFARALPALQLEPGSLDLVFFDGNMPAFLLIRHFHTLLAPGGLLVCANLELNGPQGARRAKAELKDANRWECQPALENGLTWVARKKADAAVQHGTRQSGT